MLFPVKRIFLPLLLVLGMQGAVAAQQTLGELFATDARVKGSIILAGSGTSVLSGASIQAGAQAATLKLERGGSLLVCPGTKPFVTASQTGRELMFSMNTGNLEMNYPVGASADTLLTPICACSCQVREPFTLRCRSRRKGTPACSRCRGTPRPLWFLRRWATPRTR